MAAANAGDVEVVDFDSDDDDLMDDDAPEVNPAPAAPRLRSTIAAGEDSAAAAAARKTKGRGFREEPSSSRPLAGRADFDSLGSDDGPGALRCKVLWVFPFSLSSFGPIGRSYMTWFWRQLFFLPWLEL